MPQFEVQFVLIDVSDSGLTSMQGTYARVFSILAIGSGSVAATTVTGPNTGMSPGAVNLMVVLLPSMPLMSFAQMVIECSPAERVPNLALMSSSKTPSVAIV